MTDHDVTCSGCGRAARLVTREAKYRRSGREVEVRAHIWECAAGCAGPDGARPFRFIDEALARANDQAARDAWRAKYGDEMPPGRRAVRRWAAPAFPLADLPDPEGPHRASAA